MKHVIDARRGPGETGRLTAGETGRDLVSRRRVGGLVSAVLILAGTLLGALPAAAKGHLDVLLEGLSSPKAITVGPKDIFVGQGWIGAPGPVLDYSLTGRNRGTARPVTDPVPVTDITGTPDGAGWAIVFTSPTTTALVRQASEGAAIEPILDITAYQIADPDPWDQDVPANPTESNPNGLAGLWNNDVLLVDAAGNDLIRVSPDGTARTVARWSLEPEVGTDHLGIPDFPPTLPAEAVPTTVAIGRDGWAYVGQLIGFPGKPGSAHIWRVNPDGEDQVCSVDPAVATDGCTVWKSGFTSIFDIAFNPHNGTLYVYEIAEDGWLAFEEGFATGDFPPAVLLEVKGNKTRELARGELSEPGGVAVGNDGAVYVTDGVISFADSGHGRLIKIIGQ